MKEKNRKYYLFKWNQVAELQAKWFIDKIKISVC